MDPHLNQEDFDARIRLQSESLLLGQGSSDTRPADIPTPDQTVGSAYCCGAQLSCPSRPCGFRPSTLMIAFIAVCSLVSTPTTIGMGYRVEDASTEISNIALILERLEVIGKKLEKTEESLERFIKDVEWVVDCIEHPDHCEDRFQFAMGEYDSNEAHGGGGDI